MPKPQFQTSKSPDLVAVDLTGNYVRITKARKKAESIVIEDIRQQKFDENADTDISLFLSQCYKEWNLKQRQAVCVIPSKLFISKNVDMPSNDPEEISKIIDLQAGRYTPYSREEIVIDYLCMTNPGQHYTNVLLIIVNRKLVDRYVQIFDRAGVHLDRISIASECMAHQYLRYMPSAEINGAFAGLHIDRDFSDLTIVDKQEMVFVRSLPVGALHFQNNGETARQQFVAELNKSIMAYQDQGVGQAVKALLITGLTGGLENLDISIRENVPMMRESGYPIKMVSYQKQFQLAEDVSRKLGPVNQDTFFDLMSCIQVESGLKIDLIPQEIKLKRKFREGGKDIVTMGILIMTCLLMICVFLASKIYVKKNLIDRLDESSQTISVQARLLERASTKSRVLRNLIDHRGKGLYVFDKLAALIGENIYLSSLSYDQEGSIHLLGTADSMSSVFSFVTVLENSGYFGSVVTNETKTRKEGGEEVADFDIKASLISEI